MQKHWWLLVGGLLSTVAAAWQEPLPQGYMPVEQSSAILEKTLPLRFDPDLSGLGPGEKQAVNKLLEAGQLVQELFELSLHEKSLEALQGLKELDQQHNSGKETQNLLELYRLFSGPIGVNLENQRAPFLPVEKPVSGKTLYPRDATREEIEQFLRVNPTEMDSILDTRTVVRRADAESLARDLGILQQFPGLDLLFPGLNGKLTLLATSPSREKFYAVPYSVAYAPRIMKIYALLWQAAEAVSSEDSEFAGYLRNRARDLISNDYESGDAAWVTSNFRNLNLQLGAYETYDDSLFGVKAFWSMSLLIRDGEKSLKLNEAIHGLQQMENGLPFQNHKSVRENIPVGVYQVIADFGQARGTNTASILPNDFRYARRYGRTILLRYNVLTSPELYQITQAAWNAAVAPEHRADMDIDGNFHRTLWHEIGHYLGPDADHSGRPLSVALTPYADLMEELKSDLVSLYNARSLKASGYHSDAGLRSVYASGIYRTLQKVKPRDDQPYQTMQLMQMNWFLEAGLLVFRDDQLQIHYEKYHQVIQDMLARVLDLQYRGDAGAVGQFVSRYTTWSPQLHEKLAARIRETEKFRFRRVHYAVLGD